MPLESEEPVGFDDKGAVDHGQWSAERSISYIAVDDEEFTARTVFPAESGVDAERVTVRIVLSEGAHKHSWRKSIGCPLGDH